MTRRSASLPAHARRELLQIDADEVVVATVRTVTLAEASSLAGAGITVTGGAIAATEPKPPERECGPWSLRNLDGWDEKRRDLPKENRTIHSWAPSWNESGWHPVSRTVLAYPVIHHPARLLTLSAKVLETLKDGAIVRVRVDQPLCRNDSGFIDKVRFNLGLLSEVISEAHLYPADLSDEAFTQLQAVDWELLPPGSGDRVLARLQKSKNATPERMRVAESRLNTLDRLGHDGFIVGIGRFSRYFGAKFGDRLVALENLEYGNALYLFEQDWERLSQVSRSELIRRRDPGVHRIPHVEGWQSAIRKTLRKLGHP